MSDKELQDFKQKLYQLFQKYYEESEVRNINFIHFMEWVAGDKNE